MRFERISYGQGWQRLFYVSEMDDHISVKVHEYAPDDGKRIEILKLLEPGVYMFDFYFQVFGKYVFVFFEKPEGVTEWTKELLIIVTVKNG